MIWIGQTTFSNPKKANAAAKILLEKRLAACVNILPKIQSAFWWKGKIQKSTETLLVFKTSEQKIRDTITTLQALHDYSVPVIEAWQAHKTNFSAFQWVQDETTKEPKQMPLKKRGKKR